MQEIDLRKWRKFANAIFLCKYKVAKFPDGQYAWLKKRLNSLMNYETMQVKERVLCVEIKEIKIKKKDYI